MLRTEPADMAALRAAVRAMAIQTRAKTAPIGADKRKADAPAASARSAPEVYRPRRALGQADRVNIARALGNREVVLQLFRSGLWYDNDRYPVEAALQDDAYPPPADPYEWEMTTGVSLNPGRLTWTRSADAASMAYIVLLEQRLFAPDGPWSLRSYRWLITPRHAWRILQIMPLALEREARWRAEVRAALPVPWRSHDVAFHTHMAVVLADSTKPTLLARVRAGLEVHHQALCAEYAAERANLEAWSLEHVYPMALWPTDRPYSLDTILTQPSAAENYHQRRATGWRPIRNEALLADRIWAQAVMFTADERARLRRSARGWRLVTHLLRSSSDLERKDMAASIAVALAEGDAPNSLFAE